MRLREIINLTTAADRVLLFFLIIATSFSFSFVRHVFPKGTEVEVKVDGRIAYRLPIDVDRIVSVKGPLGVTHIEIKNNKVRAIDAPCENKLCVRQGWIDRGSIICVPNRVIVSVTGGNSKKDGLDAITE